MQTSFLALVVLTCACSFVLGQDKNIAELAQNTGDLSTLVTALKAGNLVTALQGAGPFTVFAPSNEAFAKIPQAELAKLLETNNIDQLVGILKYHVVPGAAVQSKDLQATQEIKTLEGKNVLVQSISTEQIVKDIHAAINTGVPLWNAGKPEECTKVYKAVVTKYAILDSRMQKALQDAEGKPITAEHFSQGWIFRNALDAVLHAPHSGVIINGKAKVTAADNAATNGVVHIIDAVLMPPKPTKNIAELAVSVPDLSTLVTALTKGNLVTALQGDGPFTVFAPTNAAFGKLPKADLDMLLQPENVAHLVQILKYHVVSGAAVYSKDLKATQNVKTLEGAELNVAKSDAGVTINGNAKVTSADNAATNGVVHIIDAVLMPPTPGEAPPSEAPPSEAPPSEAPPSEPGQKQAVAADESATLSNMWLLTLFCILVGMANF